MWNIRISNVNTDYVYPTLVSCVLNDSIWWDLNIVIRANEEGVLLEKRPLYKASTSDIYSQQQRKKEIQMHSSWKGDWNDFWNCTKHTKTSFTEFNFFIFFRHEWKKARKTDRNKFSLSSFGVCFSRAFPLRRSIDRSTSILRRKFHSIPF